MSFREHLVELRNRLVKITIGLAIGFFVCWEFRVEIFDFLSRPIATALADNGIYHFQAIQITESIVVYLKVAFFSDLMLLSPFVFYQLWAFIGPGLYKQEKRFIIPLTAFSVVFFLIGAAFAYSVLLPFITDWLIQLTNDAGNVEVMVTLENAYSFAFTFLLMFGLVFELPLVIFFLALWGVATGKGLLKFWRYFVVLSFVLSAILTPPEPLSQLLMAIPLNLLYGFGILVAFSVSRARARDDGAAGGAALRMMGLSVAGAAAVVMALVLVIGSLPDKSLLAYVPQDASYAIGVNPKALLADPVAGRVLAGDPSVQAELEALGTGGVAVAEVTEATLITQGARRVWVLRSDGIGATAAALHPKDPAASAGITPIDRVAVALDTDVLALGHRNLVAAVVAVAFDGAPRATRDTDDERLLKRMAVTGPAWLWVVGPARGDEGLLGEVGADASHAGAVLSLVEGLRLTLHLHAPDDTRAASLDGSLQAGRDEALAAASDEKQDKITAALLGITDTLTRLAPAEEQPALARIRAALGALEPIAYRQVFPALVRLAPYTRGWSLERSERWFVMTADLDDRGLPALVRAGGAGH